MKDEIKSLVYEGHATLNATGDLGTLKNGDPVFAKAFDWKAFTSTVTPLHNVFGWNEKNPPPGKVTK